MELWVALAMGAAMFQAVRFMLQKHLSEIKLSAAGATFARFVYSAPIAVLIGLIYLQFDLQPVSQLSGSFWLYGAIGGLAQIAGTVFTVMLFGRRNFAVGLTFKKTEAMMAAVIGFLFLGDVISVFGFVALCLGLAGGVDPVRSDEGRGPFIRRILSPSTLLGISAGLAFGISGVAYRAASLTISSGDPFERAIVTLAAVTTMQLVGMAIWLWVKDRPELGRVFSTWRTASFVGITSLAGSFCWFAAFTLQNAAYVKAVGQIELIFGIAASTLVFSEKITKREILGMILIVSSVLCLVLLPH